MAHIRYDFNDYGTMVSVHNCDTCCNEFTVCPAINPESFDWDNCLSSDCNSYNSTRCVDEDDLFRYL